MQGDDGPTVVELDELGQPAESGEDFAWGWSAEPNIQFLEDEDEEPDDDDILDAGST
jgi:hypothetical protein